MKTKNKICLMSLLILVCVFTLSACGKKHLSDEFNLKKVEEAAKNVVDMVNKEDIEGIQEMTNEEMKQGMTEEVSNQLFDALKGFGKYKEITKIDINGVEDKASSKSFALAVVKAKYADKNAVYTISFDIDMKWAVLYLK